MNRRRFISSAALAVVAVGAAVLPASARPHNRDWELLGKRDVGFLADRDVIEVGKAEGDFRKIQLRVKDNGVHIMDLKVIYANGQPDDIPVRSEIPAGGQTRVIDLKGGDRFIKRVELVYKSKLNFKGHATVELWGRD
jgi:hypothetical protein